MSADDGAIKYNYTYDDTDLLTQVERVDETNPTNPNVSFKYGYDKVGNLTKSDELTGATITASTVYIYDSRNLNSEIAQTGAGMASKQVKFTYNAQGQTAKIERYANGQLAVTTTDSYDEFGRLIGIEQKNSAGLIANSTYGFDNLNRLTSETIDGVNRQIGYDKIDQVKTVTGSNSEAYTYDANGNRTNNGYATGVNNQLLNDGTYSYEYDKEGNRTKRTKIVGGVVDEYEWDYRNRLTKVTTKDGSGAGAVVTQIVGYEYDVDDQRVSKTVNGVVEKYIIDRNQIAYVTDASGTQTFHYLYGTNVDAVMAQDSPTGMVWSLSDRLGSVNLLTDAGGAVVDKRTFDSFGRVLSETNPSVKFRYGYTGREQDKETGLDYYRARYYDAANGRFISVDPAGFGAGDTNLYRYVGNSSTMYTDPTGEFAFLVPLAWAAGAAVSAGLTAAAFGGVYGFARGAAESIDSDRRNGILSGDSIGSAYINGLIGGVQGAGIGFGVGFGATSLGLGAVALGVPGAVVGGIGTTLGAVGVGGGVISAGVNFSQGNIATGVVDLASSIYGGTKLWSGYQAAKQQAFDNGFNNARQVYPEGNPQLNSTGQIVTAQSSALATTPPGWSLLPASSGSAAEETSTIFRVQGGTPPYASRNHISFDSDGNPLINKTTLNISIGDLKHAEYFLGKRPGARIFSFEIPKWMDEFIQSEAIPQLNYNSNPANQNKLAPKIVDETTPGRSYELPSIWAKWLEETAIKGSGKITDKKN